MNGTKPTDQRLEAAQLAVATAHREYDALWYCHQRLRDAVRDLCNDAVYHRDEAVVAVEYLKKVSEAATL
jgi:hypothetical protein